MPKDDKPVGPLSTLPVLIALFFALAPAPPLPAQGFGPVQIFQRNIPLVISEPGSYILVETLTVSAPAVTAILVDADNVTIDLAGFQIVGPGKGSGSGLGIDTTIRSNVVVKNGTVSSFGSVCVHLPGSNNRAQQLTVRSCGGDGIFVGRGSMVTQCQIEGSFSGVNTDDGSVVSHNTLYSIDNIGIFTSGDAPGPAGGVEVVHNNVRLAAIGIRVKGSGSRIDNNAVSLADVGIDLSLGSSNYFARNVLHGNAVTFDGEGDDVDGASIDPALSNVVLPP